MGSKIVRFSLSPQATASNFAKPLCRKAHHFCSLTRKEALSVTDLLIIQEIGFIVKVSATK